jgi:copper chaperone
MQKTFSVPDMSCEHCVKAISKALDAAGFSGYQVVLAAKEVRVETDSPEKVIALLDQEGYPAELR